MAYQPSGPPPPLYHQPQQQGAYFGDNGAGFVGGPGSPNNMVLQMGLSYGQNILSQGLQRGEQSFTSSYLPVVAKLQRYFCVDNQYVRKKLGILLFPFIRKFAPVSSVDTSGSTQDVHGIGAFGGGSGPDDGTAFSPSYGSPTGSFPNGPGANAFPGSERDKQAKVNPLPTQDYLSFDLYIPLMGSITYVILSAFLYGLVHKGSVKSDYLLSTSWVIAFWLALETLVLKCLAYALHVVRGADLLDIIALCGYKYTIVCLTVLLRQLLGLNGAILYFPLVTYAIAAVGFFAVQTVRRFSTAEDGRIPPRARLFAYITAVAQLPGILFLCFRPFF